MNSNTTELTAPNNGKKELRLLFTGVGRRVELLQRFREAGERLGIKTVIFGADMTMTAPAMAYCDCRRQVCAIRDQAYIPTLLQICTDDKIDVLIPTIDTDLLVLAQNRERFAEIGTRVMISGVNEVSVCRDKRVTADYFMSCGLHSPIPVDDVTKYSAGFPAFIKPKDGSSSINAYRVEDAASLAEYAARIDDYIIQPFIDGDEFTVDIFCDFDGNPIYITPRRRLQVRSGEVIKTQIVKDDGIVSECRALIERFRPCGAITVQLIRQRQTGIDYYIEINARFGGGSPLSMTAGADAAQALLRLALGQSVSYQPNAATEGMMFSRFDQCVIVRDAEVKRPIHAVIFDLDDTLFAERTYVESGFRAVAEALEQFPDCHDRLTAAFIEGKPAIDTVARAYGLGREEKERCLSVYRNHAPRISLRSGAMQLLQNLRARGIKIGILTDGRPNGQRAKLRALDLENAVDEILITDELGGAAFRKPCDIGFRILQKKLNCSFPEIVYVGDNPTKDFAAPDTLGMESVFFCPSDGLYVAENGRNVTDSRRAKVTDFAELADWLGERI